MIPAHFLTSMDSFDEQEPINLLLVDDDPSYLDLSSRLLARSNSVEFNVDTASNIRDAFCKCKTHDYECLLVDYKLPDGSGTDIIDLLDEYFEGMDQRDRIPPPTIIVTADAGQHAATQAIRAGAVDFIAKRDVTPQSVRRAIIHAVEKSRLETSVKQRSVALENAYELLENANKQLESKRREILNFYHTLSHEVKTPLAAAREFVSLVKDGAAGEIQDEQRELLEYAMDSCDQIKYQFTELLELARIDSGKMKLDLRTVTLDKIVKRCVASVAESLRKKRIEIVVSDIDPALTVYCDTDRIVQVISNLLTNAVRFTDTGGKISLSLLDLQSDRKVRVIVTDTGCGIAEDELDLVFERLYQVDRTGTESTQTGLGLGLSICRELLNLHDCQLRVSSNLGIGSEFYFELPQTAVEEVQTEVLT
jgi:signal transduction histidine kinase